MEDEIKELARIKFSRHGHVTAEMIASIKMADIWAMKSRVVRGDQMYLPIEDDDHVAGE